ncbi:MAG TPA: hypothetical protein VMW16_01955 [Sedimentisphaerales bacterium]|nr:hypothetical protein [Sedimentisphaerales bacterium]
MRPGGWGPLPWPGNFVSYAYHMPYLDKDLRKISFAISDMSHPAAPVCADRNPWLDKNVVQRPTDPPDYENFNSVCHGGKGQNVLYKSLAVKFEKKPTCGIGKDNIYTHGKYSTGQGHPVGTPPAGNGDGWPAGYQDAYLVGEKNSKGP